MRNADCPYRTVVGAAAWASCGVGKNDSGELKAETQLFVLLRSWEHHAQGQKGANKPGVRPQVNGITTSGESKQ